MLCAYTNAVVGLHGPATARSNRQGVAAEEDTAVAQGQLI